MSSKQYFNTIADNWDTLRKGFFPDDLAERAITAADVPAGAVAADIGAGSGFITAALLETGASVIAVDQAEAMLAHLREKYPTVDTRHGTAEALPIADATVDYVFANMFLHHVDDPLAAIREMVRILKPGGQVVITDLDAHTHEWLRTEQHDRWLGFDREQVTAWFDEAGLCNINIDCADADCCATSQTGAQADISVFMATGFLLM